MSHMLRLLITVLIAIAASWAMAGGSFEQVRVKDLRVDGETEYELVVVPIKSTRADGYKDPYLGSCETFTVRGTYARFYSAFRFPEFVTRDAHLAALSHLKEA